MEEEKRLLEVSGYLFADGDVNAKDIEDEFFKWIMKNGYYFTGTLDKKSDDRIR